MADHDHHPPLVALIIGDEGHADGVAYDKPDDDPHDSGYTVLLSDAPPPDELTEDNEHIQTVCLACLLGEHPNVEPGLDIAYKTGWAYLDPETSEWLPGENPES